MGWALADPSLGAVVRGENEFGPDLPNDDLKPEDIPSSDAPYWQGIDLFALTYDGYAAGGFHRCAKVGNAAQAEYVATGALPSTLDDLRTCLFFEQRRWRHFDRHPEEESMTYIRALLEAIRGKAEESAR
jgi:hypothetical protein